MKIKKLVKNIGILCVIILMVFLTFSNGLAGLKENTPGHCKVYSVAGSFLRGLGIEAGYCEITCLTPSAPHCKSGFLGVDCHCDNEGRCPAGIVRDIPDYINQAVLDMANNFIVFCNNFGTTNMSNLASICRNVLSAVQSNDTNLYSYWEDQFDTQNMIISHQKKLLLSTTGLPIMDIESIPHSEESLWGIFVYSSIKSQV